MRIWHQQLIPKLCRQHLLAVWRESLGAYSIITLHKKGYANHPAVLEFKDSPARLHKRLQVIRREMLNRGYHPKDLPPSQPGNSPIKLWQSLSEQIKVLQHKNCDCKV